MTFLSWPDRTRWLGPACLAVAVLAGAGASTGCAKKVVAAPLPPPPLELPVVPPRLVGPVVVEEDAPAPVAEAPEPAPARPATRPPRSGARDPVRPDPPPVDAGSARPEPGADPAAAPPAPSEPLLRTPETANDTEATRRVRDTLGRAQKNLDRVDYRTLSVNARVQADTARRFITQADAALKNRQITFARYLAEKAETLSTSLLNR